MIIVIMITFCFHCMRELYKLRVLLYVPVLRVTRVEYIFYAILCVKFVREVQFSTSKMAIISLSALVVRKVTGDEYSA